MSLYFTVYLKLQYSVYLSVCPLEKNRVELALIHEWRRRRKTLTSKGTTTISRQMGQASNIAQLFLWLLDHLVTVDPRSNLKWTFSQSKLFSLQNAKSRQIEFLTWHVYRHICRPFPFPSFFWQALLAPLDFVSSVALKKSLTMADEQTLEQCYGLIAKNFPKMDPDLKQYCQGKTSNPRLLTCA